MYCAATEQSSERSLHGQAVSLHLAILLKIQMYPHKPLSWLSSVSVEHFANESWEVCHPCKKYCKPQFQNREMPPCPHRQNATDAEFCSFLMSHSIKAIVWTLRKGLFPTKTLNLKVKQSCFPCPEENTRERQGHATMNEKVWSNWSFFSHKVSRMLIVAVCYWSTNICSIFKTQKCWFDENQQRREQEAADIKNLHIMPRQHFLSSFF